eukprot:6173791-Pleurochrysis_carterae.AAC.3
MSMLTCHRWSDWQPGCTPTKDHAKKNRSNWFYANVKPPVRSEHKAGTKWLYKDTTWQRFELTAYSIEQAAE